MLLVLMLLLVLVLVLLLLLLFQGILLVYDITDSASFAETSQWLNNIKEVSGSANELQIAVTWSSSRDRRTGPSTNWFSGFRIS